jgi:hypothetical protein
MPNSIRVTVDAVADFQIRHRAHLMGMSVSEFCARAIKKDLIGAAAEMPAAVVDKVERGNSGAGKAVAAYLSPPLATAIARLARDTQRSTSHVVRDLLRTELRNRGILPNPYHSEPAPAEAAA